MPAPHPLEELFRHADYRVRLACGGYASIRVGEPLPAPLPGLLPADDAGWGFITAWNPRGESRDPMTNRMAQRDLRDALRREHAGVRLHAGVGTLGDWREPSLFVAGIGIQALDALMLRYDQLAVVHGYAGERAQLRWSPILAPGPEGTP